MVMILPADCSRCENCHRNRAKHTKREREICSAALKEKHKDRVPEPDPKKVIIPDYVKRKPKGVIYGLH